jgi:hypothetical protein
MFYHPNPLRMSLLRQKYGCLKRNHIVGDVAHTSEGAPP